MSAPKDEIRYAFVDIGLGDCTVITWDDSRKASGPSKPRCIVVDGGKTKSAAKVLAKYLVEEGIKKIDLLVVTHIDWDHLGGIIHLFKETAKGHKTSNKYYKQLADLKVTNYWGPLPERPGSTSSSRARSIPPNTRSVSDMMIASVKQNRDLLEAMEGRVTNIYFPSTDEPPRLNLFSNLKIDLLGPDEQRFSDEYKAFHPSRIDALAIQAPFNALTLEDLNRALHEWAEERGEQARTNANNQSIVFSLTPKGRFAAKHKSRRVLLTGDAEEDLWEHMDEMSNSAKRLSAMYFKVPHHGASTGVGPGWNKVKPTLSVLSVGPAGFGHPHVEALGELRTMKRNKIYCTELNEKPVTTRKKDAKKKPDGGASGLCIKAKKAKKCPKVGNPGSLIVTLKAGKKRVRIDKAGTGYCTLEVKKKSSG
jgi:beta-lactamase superfamily II metal-dependent hydrolase